MHLEKTRHFFSRILFSNGLLSVADQFLYAATNFFIALLLGRFLDPEQFGSFLIMYSIWLFVFFLQKGICIELLYTRMGENKENNLSDIFLTQCIYSGFIFAFLLLSYTLIKEFVLFLPVFEWCVFSIAVSVLSWREYIRGIKIYKSKYLHLLAFDFTYAFLICVFLGLLYAANNLSLVNSWLVIVIASGFSLTLSFILDGTRYQVSFDSFKSMIHKHKKFMIWNGFVNVMVWAYANVYKFVLLFLLGPVYVAAIGACNYLVQLSGPILNGIQNLFLVKISRSHGKNKIRAKKQAAFIIMLTSIIFSIPLLFFPEWLLELVFGDKYLSYSVFVQFYGVSLIITGIGRIFHMQLLSINKVGKLVLAYMISFPLSMVVLVLSIKVLGIHGVNIYIIASSSLFLIATYLVKGKVYPNQAAT